LSWVLMAQPQLKKYFDKKNQKLSTKVTKIK
jgi:hypothetical protein